MYRITATDIARAKPACNARDVVRSLEGFMATADGYAHELRRFIEDDREEALDVLTTLTMTCNILLACGIEPQPVPDQLWQQCWHANEATCDRMLGEDFVAFLPRYHQPAMLSFVILQYQQLAARGQQELADWLYVVEKTLLDVLEIAYNAGVRDPAKVFVPAEVAQTQTPREQAAALLIKAQCAEEPHERQMLARRVLALDPDNADAYFVLTCDAATPAERLRLSAQAVAAGKRALGDAYERLRGRFGETSATQPCLRAMLAHASALAESGDHAAAIVIAEEMLNLGARNTLNIHRLLAHCYAGAGALDKLDALFDQHRKDTHPAFLWNRVLIEQTLGRWPQARAAVKRAQRHAPLVGKLLVRDAALPCAAPDEHDHSVRADCLRYVMTCGSMWTAAARAWLAEILR